MERGTIYHVSPVSPGTERFKFPANSPATRLCPPRLRKLRGRGDVTEAREWTAQLEDKTTVITPTPTELVERLANQETRTSSISLTLRRASEPSANLAPLGSGEQTVKTGAR